MVVSSAGPTRVRTTWLDDDRDLLELLPDDGGGIWLGSGPDLVTWGVASRIVASPGPHRCGGIERDLASFWAGCEVVDDVGVPGGGRIALASLTFDPARPGSRVLVPRRILGRDERGTWLVQIDPPGAPEVAEVGGSPLVDHTDRVRFAGSSQPDLHYLEAVAAATTRMAAGDLDKVVLARDHAVWSRSVFALRPLARRLRARFPTCWTFAVEGLVGATPELLLRRRGQELTSIVLAGTAGRDDDPELDAKLLAELEQSDKMQREHEWAARSVVDALDPHSSSVTRHPVEPLRLANVQHLATRVTATLGSANTSTWDLLAELHPTAAVGGHPRQEAMRTIDAIEGLDRDRYAAPVGWIAADGDAEFGIALRCADVSGARARLFAGAGIVIGSLPEDELQETRLKLRAMQEALSS